MNLTEAVKIAEKALRLSNQIRKTEIWEYKTLEENKKLIIKIKDINYEIWGLLIEIVWNTSKEDLKRDKRKMKAMEQNEKLF